MNQNDYLDKLSNSLIDFTKSLYEVKEVVARVDAHTQQNTKSLERHIRRTDELQGIVITTREELAIFRAREDEKRLQSALKEARAKAFRQVIAWSLGIVSTSAGIIWTVLKIL